MKNKPSKPEPYMYVASMCFFVILYLYIYYLYLEFWSTVCSKKNAANFQMNFFRFFLRSTFLKFGMQVAMASNITYIKSKKPPRLVRGHQPPRRAADWIGTCARYSYVLDITALGIQ